MLYQGWNNKQVNQFNSVYILEELVKCDLNSYFELKIVLLKGRQPAQCVDYELDELGKGDLILS